MLDLVRVVASQMVCIGHAWNLTYEDGNAFQPVVNRYATFVPYVGVMLFFVLSGFVIAFTLHSRAKRPDYSLKTYTAERFARIYSAYLPALCLIALGDWLAFKLGAPITLDTFESFIKNVLMLQGYPSGRFGGSSFGTAGQLTSLAAEFHIYFFVGGAFFFCIGRNKIAAIIVAIAAASMPLAYFMESPGDSDRNLFVLWILGFAGYFVAINMKIDRTTSIVCAALSIFLIDQWIQGRIPGREYALTGYPFFALAFVGLAIFTQGSKVLSPARRPIEALAGYAYSLFLIHVIIVKSTIFWLPGPRWLAFMAAVILPNVAACYFAMFTEAKHKRLAKWILSYLRREQRLPSGEAATEHGAQ